MKPIDDLDDSFWVSLVIETVKKTNVKSTRREERPETSMKTLFQHRKCCDVRHGFPFQGSGDCRPVYTSPSGSFSKANSQILEGISQCRCDLLGVMNLNRGSWLQRCRRPLPFPDELLEGVCCSDPRRHPFMLGAIWRKTLTSGAYMRQCVAFTVVQLRRNHEPDKGNRP